MENIGVNCNVSECMHYCCNDKCSLAKIQITHEKSSGDVVATPHFCKSYQCK